jgi:hypothetical protein
MSPDTQIRFNLWAVLTFLTVMGMSSFTFLYAEGKTTKEKQQDVIHRVIALEVQNKAILDGINDLKAGQKEVVEALNSHIKETNSLMRVKKWNDLK